jgi:hypothetical protein
LNGENKVQRRTERKAKEEKERKEKARELLNKEEKE